MFDNMCNVSNRSIVVWYGGVTGEKEVVTGSTACLGFTEITGIAVSRDDHISGIEGEDYLFLGCKIIKELLGLSLCIFRQSCRLGSNCTDGAKERAVDSSTTEEKYSTYLLNDFLSLFIQKRCG